MPELHDLSPTPGSHRDRRRVGRGPGSGTGKTSGRGHKGQGSRSGGSVSAGFEGGQMPLQRRIPKRGFTNIHRVPYQVVNVRDLSRIEPGAVTPQTLRDHGLIGTLRQPVKVLGMGELEGAYQISAHAFSGAAREKIEGAGGTVTVLSAGGALERGGRTEASAPTDNSEEASAPGGAEASEVEDETA